jgi:hypothetical protein
MESLIKILGGVFVAVFTALVTSIALLLLLPLAALDGWIMHLAWGWFVVPAFGVPGIAWALATGIVLLISWVTFQLPATKSEVNRSNKDRLASSLGTSLISWLMMFMVHLWIIH